MAGLHPRAPRSGVQRRGRGADSLLGENVGALNLYAHESRAWTTEEFSAGRLVADLAAGYLVNSQLLRSSRTLAAQLQQALDSRILVEQAKGVLAGRHGMTTDAAFEVLRGYARSHRTKIHAVARSVVEGTTELLDRRAQDVATAPDG